MARHFNYDVVKIKNSDGQYVAIPALHGNTLYETAKEHGFTGTEDEWFELLIGDGWVTPFDELDTAFKNFVQEVQTRTINGYSLDKDVTLGLDDIGDGAAAVDFSNVSKDAFVAKAEASGFQTSSPVTLSQTTFNDDGTISETYNNTIGETIYTVHTTFNDDGSIKMDYVLASGEEVSKQIVFNDDGSISESLI